MPGLSRRPPAGPALYRHSMDTDSTLTSAPLTPEPTPQKELETLHGEKLPQGARVFCHGAHVWWKIDGLWYDLTGR